MPPPSGRLRRRSWPSLPSHADAASVGDISRRRKNHRLRFRQACQYFGLAEIDEPQVRHPPVDDVYEGELSAAHDRRRWNGQGASRRPAESRLAEFAGSKANCIGQRDLDEKRTCIGIHRTADLINPTVDRDGARPEEDRDTVAALNLGDA